MAAVESSDGTQQEASESSGVTHVETVGTNSLTQEVIQISASNVSDVLEAVDASDCDSQSHCGETASNDMPVTDGEQERVVVGGDDKDPGGSEKGDVFVKSDSLGDRHNAVEAEYTPLGAGDPMVESGIEMDPSDEEDLGDTSSLNADERNNLFARGLSREKEGKVDAALKCYLGCLSGLTQNTRFVLLPQCLRNIAEIYYQNQEFDRAIHFIQVEKLYYENALINTEEIQKKLEELNVGQGTQPKTPNVEADGRTVETLRADEYEHLARLCMDKEQPQLALEYAGKCTKLRQRLFGENHPKTQESLDFFASVYAEVGKRQYIDSMETLDEPEVSETPEVVDSQNSAPSTPTGDGNPVSILRHRRQSEGEKKQVRFHESVVDNSQQREQEEWVSRTVVSMLLFICCFFLTVLGLGLYCRVVDSNLCRSMVAVAHDAYLNVRYQYYKYTSTKLFKFA